MIKFERGITEPCEISGILTTLHDLARSQNMDTLSFSDVKKVLTARNVTFSTDSAPLPLWVRTESGEVLRYEYQSDEDRFRQERLFWQDFQVHEQSGLIIEDGELVGLEMGSRSFVVASPFVDLIEVEESAPGSVLFLHESTALVTTDQNNAQIIRYGSSNLKHPANPLGSYLEMLKKTREKLSNDYLRQRGQAPDRISARRDYDDTEITLIGLKNHERFAVALKSVA